MRRITQKLGSSTVVLGLLTLATPVAHAAGAGNTGGGFDLSWLGWLTALAYVEVIYPLMHLSLQP